jgi:integrase
MKLSEEQIFDWIDSISKQSTAKNYKARIAKVLRDRDDIYKDIVSLKLLTDIVETYTSASTLKGIVQVFLKIIAEYPGFKISEKAKKKWEEVFAESNADMNQGYIQKSMEDTTESFSAIKQKVFDGYPEGSDERLYMELYEICAVRDNFGSLHIVQTLRDTKDKSKDYLVISKKILQINNYKTANKYGAIECKIPIKLFRKIDLTREKVFEHGETLTSWVGKILKSVGVGGRVNTLRHAFLSEKLDGDAIKDPEVRKELAKSMGHSGTTQLGYIRDIEK